jgi:hypothetical protein
MAVRKALFVAWVCSCLAIAVSAQSGSSPLPLTGHLPQAVRNGQALPVAQLSSKQHLNLAIGLPLRDRAGLVAFLQQLYDPQSPVYRHYLTPQEFTDRFGPTQSDYQAVISFAHKNGLTVTHLAPNRLLVDVDATVADIERAFHVHLVVYQHPSEDRTFFAPDAEPSIEVGVPVMHVTGLENFAPPRPMGLKRTPMEQIVRGNTTGTGPNGLFLGSDFRAAYAPGVTLDGSGQTVGLFEFGPFNLSDVQQYFTSIGQPFNVPVNTVLLDGVSGDCVGTPPNGCDDGEEVIDIEQAVSMAPGLTQVIVYEGNNDADMFNQMAVDNIAQQLSCSFGFLPPDPNDDAIFLEFAAQGQNLFVASGDSGAFSASNIVFAPADDANITAVGGTSLTTSDPGGPWQSETAWIGSSGGISTNGVPIPSYQVPVINAANQGSTTLRNIPDVAGQADTNSYFCGNQSCGGVGGTSLAAPQWAGFLALVNEQAAQNGNPPIGFLNPIVYAIGQGPNYNKDFHDITTGNDFNDGSPNMFSAVKGYDLVTGWGTPTGQDLIDELAGTPNLPAASLSLGNLDFGEQNLNTRSPFQVVKLTNNGPGTLFIGGVSLTGDFLLQGSTCGDSLAAFASCALEIAFEPTATGTRSGILTLSDNALNRPQTAVLTGTGMSTGGGPVVINFLPIFPRQIFTLNGNAAIVSNAAGQRVLRLTNGGAKETSSAFATTAVPLEFFTTDFTFQLTNPNGEGFAFVIQGNSPTSLGAGLAGLGYAGIPNSVAVKFDLTNNGGEGDNSTGAFTGGAPPTVPSIDLLSSGVNLHTGDIFYVHMNYDGNNLAWTITDSGRGKTFSGSVPINIPGQLGSSTGFVGFTASTGNTVTATQDILTWTFQTPGLIAPFASLTPAALSFGDQNIGTTSAAQALTLTNHGPGQLIIQSIGTKSDFLQTNNCPIVLPVAPATGSSCTIKVSFKPAVPGTSIGALDVNDNAFNKVQASTALGTALNPKIPVRIDLRNGFGGTPGLALNGKAAIKGAVLRLTDGGRGEASSAYFVPPLNVQSFVTDFAFQLTNATADGFTFVLQRNSPTALGQRGGQLGYGGIPNSVAIKFDLFSDPNGTGLLINGSSPTAHQLNMASAGIQLNSGHIFLVHVGYDGTALSWSVTDSTTFSTFTTSTPVNIPAILGGADAFVGFTGGTGGLSATQDILSWTYQTAGTTPPFASLDTTSLAFSPENLGVTSGSQTVHLTNNGPGALTVNSVNASGDFSANGSGCSTLAAGASCAISVTFTPTASGPRLGTLTISDNASINPQTVSLSGSGILPGGTITANFGGGFAGAPGLTLNGNASINGTRLELTDGGGGETSSAFVTTPVDIHAFANDFVFQITNPSPNPAADGFTFTIQGNSPTALGGGGGALGYGTDGVTPAIGKSVAVKFDLFADPDGTGVLLNGADPTVAGTNMGSAGIHLSSGDVMLVHMTYDGATLAWTVTDATAGATFSTSAAVDIPGTVGGTTAFVGFTGADGGFTSVQDILAWTFESANANTPLASVSPVSILFVGTQALGTTSSPQPVTLTNHGATPLSISTIATTGDFGQTNNCGTSLPAGGNCTINVTFTPSASGPRSGSLIVQDDAFVSQQSVSLEGNVGAIGDCGQARSGSGNGSVDYLMVYKSSKSIVCVDRTFWLNPANSTAIPGFFSYFDAVVAQDKALFPVTAPNTQFVFEITVPTGGASTGCGFSTLGNGGSFCDTVTGDAFTNVFTDPVSHAPIPGFFGFLLSLHESVNVFTGLASSGWPTDWWADHRSPFPNTMDLEFMQSIANNNSSLSTSVKQALLASATAQSERFIDPANPTGEHDNEVVLFNNIFNNQVFNNPNIVGFTGYANMVNLAINEDGLQWPSVSQDRNFTGDDNFSENLSEYVIAYLHLGFQSTTNQTAAFTSAGVGTLDATIPSYSVNPANVLAIANAHCSIRAAANAGVNVSTQMAALQSGNFQNATATGGTQASCPSECAFSGNQCVAKFNQ